MGLRVETEQSQSTRVRGFRTNRKKERTVRVLEIYCHHFNKSFFVCVWVW